MWRVQKGCWCHDFHKGKYLAPSRASQLKSQGTQRSKEYFLQFFMFFLRKKSDGQGPKLWLQMMHTSHSYIVSHCSFHKSTICGDRPCKSDTLWFSWSWTAVFSEPEWSLSEFSLDHGPLPLCNCLCFGNNNTIYAFKVRNNVIKSDSDIQEKTIFWKLDISPSSGLCWC